jgi:hypothetical protein
MSNSATPTAKKGKAVDFSKSMENFSKTDSKDKNRFPINGNFSSLNKLKYKAFNKC